MPRKSNIVVELESQINKVNGDLDEIQTTVTTLTDRLKQLEEQKASLQFARENYSHLLSVAKSTRIRTAKAKKPTATATPEAAAVSAVSGVGQVIAGTVLTTGEPSTTATDAR